MICVCLFVCVCVCVLQAKIDELTCGKKLAEEKAAQLQSELDLANEEVERLELEVERGFEDKVGGLEAELRRSRSDSLPSNNHR